jgi:threonyl-tRNA synthetase
VRLVLDTLGIGDFRVRVGLRDPASDKYVGSKEAWDKAEKAVKEAAMKLGDGESCKRGGKRRQIRKPGKSPD